MIIHMNIHKGDQVKIRAGNDKGKVGKVLAVLPKTGMGVVEGMNLKKKHVKPKRQNQKGELVRIPAAFPVSRMMLVCPSCKVATRVGKVSRDDKAMRICKHCGAEF